jgi:prevent-host-death family protein
MKSIGIRELRQQASKYLREVERGETFEVTEHGRPGALLTPIPQRGVLDRLIAEGRATPATATSRRDFLDRPPVEPKPGIPLPSEILARMREDER